MRSSPICHCASFSFDGAGRCLPVSEKERRDAAARLATTVSKRGFDVGDVFGSSTDVWGVAVRAEGVKFSSMCLRPKRHSTNDGDYRGCFPIRDGSRRRANDVLQK